MILDKIRIRRMSSVFSPRDQKRRLRAGLRCALSLTAAFILSPVGITHAHTTDTFLQQRADYQVAMGQLATGQTKAFYQTLESLETYPLYPYLEFELINSKLRKLPQKEVKAFVDKYEGEPIARKMTKRWLNKLIRKHQWQKVVDSWDPSIKDARLNCWHLRATYRIGEKEKALSQVQPLWLKPSSQPKACDPLFKEWIEEGYLTQDVAWQRLEMAMNARRVSLASYIARKLLRDEYAELGKAYITAHRRPHKLPKFENRSDLANHSEKLRNIATYGLKRLARKNPELAKERWEEYKPLHSFEQSEIDAIELAITISAAAKRAVDASASDLDEFADAPADAIEKRIRVALRETDWQSVFYLIQNLPEEEQAKNRWQYWLARSMEEEKLTVEGIDSPQVIYEKLSQTRSYYGFLAADLLRTAYSMQDYPATIGAESLDLVKNNDEVIRALELFAVNQIKDARLEWFYGTRGLDAEALLVAGKFAQDFNWHEKAIRAYIKAQYWNDLQTRFPLAYKSKIVNASKEQKLDTSWVFAIARQESAFSPDARSHAGALGLMQIMPGTGKQTAREMGLKFRRNDLLKPETNINIGSNYLRSLLEEFNGNRILATTAYNAGPHRVKGWLKKTKNNLPFDVWIETIPFKETRHYVQNVLAFSVIYDYRMSEESQLVTSVESSQLL